MMLGEHWPTARRTGGSLTNGSWLSSPTPDARPGPYIDSNDAALLERTYAANSATWEKTLIAPAAAVQNELDGVVADNPAARDAKPEQFLDNRLAEELERGCFIQRLYQ